MNTQIFKVISQGEAQTYQKTDGSILQKCPIRLKELGGKYASEYAATLLGGAALCRFREGELVAAVLYFTTHDYEGRTYQDIAVQDIEKINN